ncbi:MAG TPA: histidinol-phosphatase [Rubrivivax sp.]|nr:histidinol-phosphatase [Burkholderiales bacterium]HNT38743.1 histidinol-phosphatase [Rubrivivax sp.]
MPAAVVAPPWTDEVLDFAQDLMGQARSIALRWFRHRPTVETKADASPVTVADREVEQFLRAAIRDRYPEHGLLGEEFGTRNADAEVLWCIDPIDGTRSFVSGSPLWGCLLAVLHRGRPLLGLVEVPCTRERWVGIAGRGAWLNGERCRTRTVQRLEDAILYATSPDLFSEEDRRGFERLSAGVQMRRFGGDCYTYALLASGMIDVVAECNLQPYDYMALVPVVHEAGGVMTDWEGRALDTSSDGRVVAAANHTLHRLALQQLAA